MDATTKPAPTSDEIWVGGRHIKIVEEMLLAIGEEHNMDVWLNGRKIHTATVAVEEQDGHPK